MPRLETVLSALAGAGVRFVVVGGVAVVLHGHPRLTADLDLVVDLDPDHIGPAMDVLTELGLRPSLPVAAEDFTDPDIRQRWIDERGMTVFSLHHPDDPLHGVDLFADPPLPFEVLWDRAQSVEVAGAIVPVASIDHLIEMKRTVGRPRDEADIAALEELRDDA